MVIEYEWMNEIPQQVLALSKKTSLNKDFTLNLTPWLCKICKKKKKKSSSKFQSTQDGHSIWVFEIWLKGKMANVMLEILDGFSLIWVLMYWYSKSSF